MRGVTVLADLAAPDARTHVATLPRLVTEVLGRAGLAASEIDAVAVSIGPGSFTGLRIGLSFAKGLAFAGPIPIVAVPTLEALARLAPAEPGQTVCAALDARKQECWAALFRCTVEGVERLSPDVALAPAALAERLPPGAVLVGDAGTRYGDVLGTRARLLPFAEHHPRGGMIARLGAERLARGQADDAGTLEPTYVRPSEAELVRAGRDDAR